MMLKTAVIGLGVLLPIVAVNVVLPAVRDTMVDGLSWAINAVVVRIVPSVVAAIRLRRDLRRVFPMSVFMLRYPFFRGNDGRLQ